jgi:UDP-N-acetylmuramoyl-L-alanyl-D-glutamate--2,6-diaminopimelate ligase
VIGYLTPDAELVQAFRTHRHRRTRPVGPAARIFKTAVKLSDLFTEENVAAIRGTLDRPISGIVLDSRRVAPGNLFFALPGLRSDGARFIDEAIERGAHAVVCSAFPLVVNPRATFIRVEKPRDVLAEVSRRYFNSPDEKLDVVGVTGTNGKTTVAHLVRHILSGGTERVGMLGTIQYDLGGRMVPSYKTTPESLDVYGLLSQMRSAGCKEAVMEVSSHGIDQKRVQGIKFAVAVFTNLTRDHLDYHGSIESYFEVKSRLFTGATGFIPAASVINMDDEYGRRLLSILRGRTGVVTFGESPEAEVSATGIRLGFKSTKFRLVWPGGSADVDSPLIGRYNVSNALAAIAACRAMGRDPAECAAAMSTFKAPPGRMERIEEGQPFNVLVDYAHTDDALRNALGMLRGITPGRLLVVFGCGGNRDRTKRPLMTAAVQETADFSWATSDNPRSESPDRIFMDMKAGVAMPERIAFIEDRRRAISLALDAARPGVSLLMAGKGHETFQEFADTVVPVDVRQVVRVLIGVYQRGES